MTSLLVDDGLIHQIRLYENKFWLARWDVFPFLVGYATMFSILFFDAESEFAFPCLIGIPILLSLHLIIFLFAQSSVLLRCFIGKSVTTDINRASYALVFAAKNAGKDKVVPMLKRNAEERIVSSVNVISKSFKTSDVAFQFQEVTYLYDASKQNFVRLNYPIEMSTKVALKWEGFESEETTIDALRRWGFNEFAIPMPHFLDLYMVLCIEIVFLD